MPKNLKIEEKGNIVRLIGIGFVSRTFFMELKDVLSDLIKQKGKKVILDLRDLKGLKFSVYAAISVIIRAFTTANGILATLVKNKIAIEDLQKGNFGDIFNPYLSERDVLEFFKKKDEQAEKRQAAAAITGEVERKYWINIDDVQPGDIIARDIYNEQSTLIVKENVKLTDKLIKMLHKMGEGKVQILLLDKDAHNRNLVQTNNREANAVEMKEKEEKTAKEPAAEPKEHISFERMDNIKIAKFLGEIAQLDIDILTTEIEQSREDMFFFDFSDVPAFDIKLILPFTNAIYARDDIGRCFFGLKKNISILFKSVSALRYVRIFNTLEDAIKNKQQLMQSVMLARKNNIITKELSSISAGERLARPIFDQDGRLLFKANEFLNDKIIKQLTNDGITAVDVLKSE